MNNIGKKLLYVALFIAGFVAVKYGFDTYNENQTTLKVEESLDHLKAEGAKKYPDLPVRQIIVQDMKDFASSNKASIKQACEAVAENGQTLARDMHISKLQPAVYKALTTGE